MNATIAKPLLFICSIIFSSLISKAQYVLPLSDADFEGRQISTSKLVGVIDGQHGTTQTGAATYTIPIKITPGTNGMEPDIAISYNSQSGNGLLGMG